VLLAQADEMLSMKYPTAFLTTVAALSMAAAAPAQAYIDPGTGSMLLQVIGAVIAGAIFYFRELRLKILSMFSRRRSAPAEENVGTPTDDPPR
jgi:hypothetical protein